MTYAVMRAGGTQVTLAGALGVSARTIRNWLDEERGYENGPAFRAAYARAKAELHQDLVGCITAAAPSDWKAAAWMLERRYSESYSHSVKLQVQEQIHEGLRALRDELGEEMSAKVLRVISEASGANAPRTH